MSRMEALEEYAKALKLGQKEARECQQKNRPVNPEVLYHVAGELAADRSICIGLVEIPAERIVGTKSAGRITAFTATFHAMDCSFRAPKMIPLLPFNSP